MTIPTELLAVVQIAGGIVVYRNSRMIAEALTGEA